MQVCFLSQPIVTVFWFRWLYFVYMIYLYLVEWSRFLFGVASINCIFCFFGCCQNVVRSTTACDRFWNGLAFKCHLILAFVFSTTYPLHLIRHIVDASLLSTTVKCVSNISLIRLSTVRSSRKSSLIDSFHIDNRLSYITVFCSFWLLLAPNFNSNLCMKSIIIMERKIELCYTAMREKREKKLIMIFDVFGFLFLVLFLSMQMPNASASKTDFKSSSRRWSHHIILVLFLYQVHHSLGSPVFTFNPSVAQCKYWSKNQILLPVS